MADCGREIVGDCGPAGQAARANNNTVQQRAKTMTGLQWDRGPLNAPATVMGLAPPQKKGTEGIKSQLANKAKAA
ncbi:hypothetical protein SM139_1330 [Stenotrophomonas maltophilia]|nr:hypothetical protein SM139_1330 [Stenotrophomonas maltophilia]